MKRYSVFAVALLTLVASGLKAQSLEQLRAMQAAGEVAGARTALAKAVDARPNDVSALTNYAEFLQSYGDPACNEVYRKLLTALRQQGDSARAAVIAKRIALYDITIARGAATPPEAAAIVHIPGPLRSFARMAAISGEANPDDILAALARNVVTNGYQASHGSEGLEQTEFLKLVHRYISQARELEKVAGADKIIQVENCESPVVADLLRVLGFRIRGGCGSEVVLETVNASRAFLTTDSGFPIHLLEEALRTNRPFTYDFHPAEAHVMFSAEYWMTGVKDKDADFIETFIGDPSLCRLYLGFAKLDSYTAEEMRKAVPFTRLKAFAHVLDFFGGMFEIRDGKAVLPGGPKSAQGWSELVGASPDKGTEFFDKLMAKDDGWVASLYDATARIHGPLQDYLTQPDRMRRFYTAVRGRITSPGPARPVFRANSDMMLLTTRLRLDPDGKPHVPGSLDVWKSLFINHPQGKYDGKLTKLAANWKEPDDVIEALFALSRKTVENEPLKIFMALSDLDYKRAQPLQAATIDRLAREYHDYGPQYPVFGESRSISDKTVIQILDTINSLDKVGDKTFRSDLIGTYQSLVGLWQILVRQHSIPDSQADAALFAIASSFVKIGNNRELFDAGRAGVKTLLAAAPAGAAGGVQDHVVNLLGGGVRPNGDIVDADVHQAASQEILRILDSQRILGIDTIFELADNLEAVSKGEKLNTALVAKLTSRVSEIQLPRATLTSAEQNAMGFGYWSDKHIEMERKLNLRSAIEKAGADAEKLRDIRGQLAPHLRDTLLAYNYAYYAPPGAQILYTNPQFVRGHDFLGQQGNTATWKVTEVYGSGWPSNAGGRLVGSLSSLPYALAESEQNFLVPTQTQALIWGDLVPQMMLSATASRWWGVTPSQLHWVALHLLYGRELVAEAASDAAVRDQVVAAIGQLAAPVRVGKIKTMLARGDVADAMERITPSEMFLLARELAPKVKSDDSCLRTELRRMADAAPQELNYTAISRAFGTPKPTLANSYEPEMLNLRTFPTLMGYSSRIMAESWESNTLYWAGLADELSMAPAQLNVRIPEWTRKLVEQIFASHLEDWPALLKSLRQVGDDVRTSTRAALAEQKGDQ